MVKRWWTDSSIYWILSNIPTPASAYISDLWLHLILSTAPIINFPSNMPFSQAMQLSSSTIALQPLTSWWLLDSDDYCIHSKNHHKLYPPPHAKLSYLKSITKWSKNFSPPTSLPYHIGDPIFFKDSFILYAFIDFVDSDDYNSAWRKEHVAEFQATILAKTSIPTVQLQVHHSRWCDHAQPWHVSRWARIKAKLCSYSCCWSIIKWLIQLTHFRAIEEITEVSLIVIPIVFLYDSTSLPHDSSLIHSISFLILLFSSLLILFYS